MKSLAIGPGASSGPKTLLRVIFLVAIGNLALLAFVVPVFGVMFANFGASLPWPTQRLLDLSNTLAACYGLGYVVITLAFIFVFKRLHAKDDPTGALRRYTKWTLSLFVFLTLVIIDAAFMPCAKFHHVGEGLMPANWFYWVVPLLGWLVGIT